MKDGKISRLHNKMNHARSIFSTPNGHRVYGAGTAVMDVNKYGIVTYSNLYPESKEYKNMVEFYQANKDNK